MQGAKERGADKVVKEQRGKGRDEHGKLSMQPVRTKLANNIS